MCRELPHFPWDREGAHACSGVRDSARGGHTAGAWYLIESCNASEDDVGILHLDDALAQPYQVRTDPDGTTGHLGKHTRTREVTGEKGLQHSPRAPGE